MIHFIKTHRSKVLVMVLSLFALQTSYYGDIKAAPVGMMATTTGKFYATWLILRAYSNVAKRQNRTFTWEDQKQVLKAAALGLGFEAIDWMRWYSMDNKKNIDNDLRADIGVSSVTSGLFRMLLVGNMGYFAGQAESLEEQTAWRFGAEGLFGITSLLAGLQFFGFVMSFDNV